ncbi:C40 family peptidase [Cohnella thailandensis]|jgi:Cell wall-associated hydrolases (invasion-associated proteins)|uniref:C40 family peptidase n=1 Tax=Cohnella thailandensis TaxID=557557 RepID=A0A841T2C8_9BACL|nr:C40 family peptidase [Cohnella thailandensis]MBB6637006.1 C40 family peptidase [Cohnella thailandensis]MBP1973110.1 cell wall-associated NlpC family hydrolase [Cohnella thailandensis]
MNAIKSIIRHIRKFAVAGLAMSVLIGGAAEIVAPKQASAATTTSSTKASKIIAKAKTYLGKPYKFGATTGKTASFDCSSLTQYLYRLNGVSLPRSSAAQSKSGKYVSKANLKPGDLVFFYSPIHHVGIYIGNGKIIHTYGKPGVTIDSIDSGWWKTHYKTARRVL